jgi:hypothetical protein
MPPTPAETNSPVLLDQARRYVDAEDDRVAGLQTRAASLLAAVLVLVGLTFTVESQFPNRDLPRWISLAVAGSATVALLASAAVGDGGIRRSGMGGAIAMPPNSVVRSSADRTIAPARGWCVMACRDSGRCVGRLRREGSDLRWCGDVGLAVQ